jgi:DNA-binding response OmpR family regulator
MDGRSSELGTMSSMQRTAKKVWVNLPDPTLLDMMLPKLSGLDVLGLSELTSS